MSVIALAACGDNDDAVTTPVEPAPTPRLLTVEVSENPMQDNEASAREMNRTAAATTTMSLSSFTMNYTDAWYQEFTKIGGSWSPTETPWPISDYDTKIDFYAYTYNADDYHYNGGNPYISFTMDNNAFSQKDLLVATHKQISYNDTKGVVSLTFDHACAAVQFYVYKEEDADYTINSILLKGMKNKANYNYNTGWEDLGYSSEWSSDESKRYYTLTNGDIEVTNDKKRLPCEWLFLIPQSKDDIQIEINYNGSKTKTLNLTGNWEAGKQYTVNIRIGKKAS